jgi:hypothetical protein
MANLLAELKTYAAIPKIQVDEDMRAAMALGKPDLNIVSSYTPTGYTDLLIAEWRRWREEVLKNGPQVVVGPAGNGGLSSGQGVKAVAGALCRFRQELIAFGAVWRDTEDVQRHGSASDQAAWLSPAKLAADAAVAALPALRWCRNNLHCPTTGRDAVDWLEDYAAMPPGAVDADTIAYLRGEPMGSTLGPAISILRNFVIYFVDKRPNGQAFGDLIPVGCPGIFDADTPEERLPCRYLKIAMVHDWTDDHFQRARPKLLEGFELPEEIAGQNASYMLSIGGYPTSRA